MSGARDVMHGPRELALKGATRDLVELVGGTDGAAATLTRADRRVRQQRVSDCQCGNTPDFLRIDEAARLEDVAIRTPAWPPVTRALARRHGFELVQRPESRLPRETWHRLIGALAKEAGELGGGLCNDLSDDHDVSAEEAEARLGDASDLVRVAVELEAALRARAGDTS